MGADLYIIPDFEEKRRRLDPAWNEAIRLRNAHEKHYGNRDHPKVLEAQQKVSEIYNDMYSEDVYYRDSYNDWNLLWLLGLSYWQDFKVTKQGLLDARYTRKLIRYIQEHEVPDVDGLIQHFKERADGHRANGYEEIARDWPFQDSPGEVHEYFVEKRQQLLKFLVLAVESGKRISASV